MLHQRPCSKYYNKKNTLINLVNNFVRSCGGIKTKQTQPKTLRCEYLDVLLYKQNQSVLFLSTYVGCW